MAFLLQLIYPFLTIASYVIFTDMHFNRNCIL